MNKTETKLNIRLDKKTKEKARKTLDELGLDLSSGVKLFLKTVISTQSIPFEIRTKNGYTDMQEMQIVKESGEAVTGYVSGKQKGFRSAEELVKSLL